MTDALFDESLQPPGWLSLLSEWRALTEIGVGWASAPGLALLPHGDDQPVLVIPGFLTSDLSTVLLRTLLVAWGYRAETWDLGHNLRLDQPMVDKVAARLHALRRKHGRKLSLIGWSLGGVFAREVARANPGDVRQVITLASPFARNFKATSLRALYECVNGGDLGHIGTELIERMKQPVPVPSTALYTRSDGIVAWQSCIDSVEGPITENISVPGSHCGLVSNPIALTVVADRLRQPEGGWRRFDSEKESRRAMD
jgi:pimeloyl-ACP methyl ester carboxylesterase